LVKKSACFFPVGSGGRYRQGLKDNSMPDLVLNDAILVAHIRHSGESRARSEAFQCYPRENSTVWIPAFAGMTLEDFLNTDSLNLG
jgi:hypothetical protein